MTPEQPDQTTSSRGVGVSAETGALRASSVEAAAAATRFERSAKSDFDINEGAASDGMRLPSLDSAALPGEAASQIRALSTVDIATYARIFENFVGANFTDPNSLDSVAKALGVSAPRYESVDSVAKALNAPPSAFNFGRISYMPDSAVNGGVMQWPGLAPDALKKIVRENVAPQLIIGTRVDDVLRYGELSTHLWKPGWRIGLRDSTEAPTAAQLKDIEEATTFLRMSNIETSYAQARKRDEKHLSGFKRFLASGVRDMLTFDTLAVWTDMRNDGWIKSYAQLPAGNIRLATRAGYQGDISKFAVAVDDGGRVIQAFTRDELTFYTLNPRNDPDAFGYGYSMVEVAMRLIKGFQNALDLNISIFDRNAINSGILTISGGSVTQRQLDLLNRLITNMKKGVTKAWALPVIGLQGDSKLELVDLSPLKEGEAYYKDFLNMLAGALCVVWRFPVRRFGYRISGHGRDTQPEKDGQVDMLDQEDPGLAPLLGHFETFLNEYILWPRWPHLEFGFTGKSPREDARAYEAKSLAQTWGEKRAAAGLPKLETLAPPELKPLAQIMSLAPSDPNYSGIFQTVAAEHVNPEGKDKDAPGARMESSADPAKKEAHGHRSGVRRDSAAEGGKG